jgi:hypothetical protein
MKMPEEPTNQFPIAYLKEMICEVIPGILRDNSMFIMDKTSCVPCWQYKVYEEKLFINTANFFIWML